MQNKIEEKKQIYEVILLKHNQEHIVVISTDKYDTAFEKWEQLTKTWTEALKDKVPLIIKDPIVTAFDPGLVKEITVRPIMEVLESKYENPYQQSMMKNGLSKVLRNTQNSSGSPDLLDEGYN